jgi:uncharacterized glyoxalase superfamily protein PhnB
VLGVPNVRQAAEYYRDVLGFRLDPVDGVFRPVADEPGGVYGIVDREGVRLHLQIRRGERAARPQQRGAFERDVYLYVHDLDAVFADLQRRGAKVQPPKRAPYGLRECEVEDLNGYRLTFGELER